MTKVIEINCETGEVIKREMTDAELAQQKIDKEQSEKYLLEVNSIKVAREALLAKLGITEDEAKLLLS